MGIWGIVVEPGKRFRQEVDQSFVITMAAIEPSPPKQNNPNKPQASYTSVMADIGDQEVLLCTLNQSTLLQQPLNLPVEAGDEITFFLNGSTTNRVHLTGYLAYDDDEGDYGYDPDETGETEDVDDDEEIDSDEVGSDDEDETPAKFIKSEAHEVKPKSAQPGKQQQVKGKPQAVVNGGGDEDSEDDDEDEEMNSEDERLMKKWIAGGEGSDDEDEDDDEEEEDDDEDSEEGPSPQAPKSILKKQQQGGDKRKTPEVSPTKKAGNQAPANNAGSPAKKVRVDTNNVQQQAGGKTPQQNKGANQQTPNKQTPNKQGGGDSSGSVGNSNKRRRNRKKAQAAQGGAANGPNGTPGNQKYTPQSAGHTPGPNKGHSGKKPFQKGGGNFTPKGAQNGTKVN